MTRHTTAPSIDRAEGAAVDYDYERHPKHSTRFSAAHGCVHYTRPQIASGPLRLAEGRLEIGRWGIPANTLATLPFQSAKAQVKRRLVGDEAAIA